MSIPATAPLPFPQRVRDTFVAPRRLFDSLRPAAPWFDVLLVSTLVAVLLAAATPAELLLEQAENPVNRRGRPVEITSPPSQIVFWGRLLAMMSAVVGHPIIAFALAGLLALIFSVLGPGTATFREYLSVTAHALLVYALGGLLTLALQWATGDAGFEPTVGRLLLGGTRDGVAARVLVGINPFTVWMLILLALGTSRLNRGLPLARTAAVLLGLYLVLAVALGMQTGT